MPKESFDEKEIRLLTDLERIGIRPEICYTPHTLNLVCFAIGLVVVLIAETKLGALLGAGIASIHVCYRPSWKIKIENDV